MTEGADARAEVDIFTGVGFSPVHFCGELKWPMYARGHLEERRDGGPQVQPHNRIAVDHVEGLARQRKLIAQTTVKDGRVWYERPAE